MTALDSPTKRRGRPVGSTKPAEHRLDQKTIRTTDEEWKHCLSKGNASEYIRGLIAKDRKS